MQVKSLSGQVAQLLARMQPLSGGGAHCVEHVLLTACMPLSAVGRASWPVQWSCPPMHVTSCWEGATQGSPRDPLTKQHLIPWPGLSFLLSSSHDSCVMGAVHSRTPRFQCSLEAVQLAHRTSSYGVKCSSDNAFLFKIKRRGTTKMAQPLKARLTTKIK